MKDLKKVQEFFSKPLEEVSAEYLRKNNMHKPKNIKEGLGNEIMTLEAMLIKLNQTLTYEKREGEGKDLKQIAFLENWIEDTKAKLKEKLAQHKQGMNEAKSNPEVDKLLKVMNTKKGGPEYKKALMDLISIAEKKSGKTINTKKEALLALDYVEPTIREAKQEDPTDIIAMDVPLFLRMLEYAREDAEQDIDLHKVTERAIEAVKLRGLLSMEDYQDIVGEPIDEMTGYSKYLATPENPKGKTQGLTQDVMDKILLKIATMGDDDVEETTRLGEGVIYEELCPKGKAYITKRKAAGEKSSAYLSGRAVKVCKGQMQG